MNIFEYFEKSGKGFYLDEKRKSTWFNRTDGTVIERPHDGSYWRTISPSWYDRGVLKPQFNLNYYMLSVDPSVSGVGSRAAEYWRLIKWPQ